MSYTKPEGAMGSDNSTRTLRTSSSSNDFHSLAKSFLSFTDRSGRAKSFSQSQPQPRKNCICVNFRDCGLVSPDLRQGCVYRSSQVVSSEEVQALNLKAVLDLRVLKKPCKQEADLEEARVKRSPDSNSFMTAGGSSQDLSSSEEEDAASLVKSRSRQHISGCRMCAICTEEFGHRHNVNVPIYHSDLVPWTTKLRVFGKLPSSAKLKAFSEICHLRNPEKMVQAAVVDPDVMGINVLYRLLLDHSKPSFAKAMRIFAEEANYPVLVHCIHGKDRTGLIVMLMLLLCDVPVKLVVADYIQSELQLKAGRDKGDLHELDDSLVTDSVIASKAETMVETVAHLEANYGSAHGYCKAIGLEDEEIARIRANFKVRNTEALEEGGSLARASEEKQIRDFSSVSSIQPPQPPNGFLPPGGGPERDVTGGESELGAQPPVEPPAVVSEDGVISEAALQAAGEAVVEELEHPSVKPRSSLCGSCSSNC